MARKFDAYEVHGCKEYKHPKGVYTEQVEDSEADFWSLFGHIQGEGVQCIGDFRSRAHAEEVMQLITGEEK